MINRSTLGGIVFIAAIGIASPSFAANPYSPALNGGGSTGYNHNLAKYYRLKGHHVSPQAREHQASKSQQKPQ